MEVKSANQTRITSMFDEAAKQSFLERSKRYRLVRFAVEGYDTSLPVKDIEDAVTNRFSKCGKIFEVWIPKDPLTGVVDRCAYMNIYGPDIEEKVLALNGSDVGECKIIAKPSPSRRIFPKAIGFGSSTVPVHCIKKPMEMMEE